MKLHKILISFIFLSSVSAGILQNPDFELPPPHFNTTAAAAAAPFFPVNGTAIPGWSSNGVVQYVTFGPNSSVPQSGGHGVALGQDGKINQTFIANGGAEKVYLLTFALTRNVSGKCDFNASVVVSAPDSSAQFELTHGNGKQGWEVYGHRIGEWGNGESVNLVIGSGDSDADEGATCWPVIDGLELVAVGPLVNSDDNLLQNGGFELGPSFPDDREGVLLNSQPSLIESALPQWTVTGTVKYISTKNLFFPQGKAAVELVSGGSGVQTVKQLTKGSNYNLTFKLGDANDSCSGDLAVAVVAGSSDWNFTVPSNGTGSSSSYSVTFQGLGPSTTQISFQSYTTRQSVDGVFCGPVIDGVVLHRSGGYKMSVSSAFLVAWLLLVVLMMISD